MNRLKYIMLFIYLIIYNSSFGLDTLSINSDFQKIEMKQVSGIFRCNDDDASIERFQAIQSELFTPLLETGVSFPASDEVYWVKTIIENKDSITRQFIVKVDNPVMNKIRFFIIKDSIVKASKLMGNTFIFHQRDIKNRNFLHPITLTPNERIELYIYANKAGKHINLFMSLWDKTIFEEEDNKEATFLGFYIGFLFSICLMVLLITIFSRLKLLVYFTIYCFALTLNLASWLGLGYKYLWSNFPYFNAIFGYTLFSILSICLLAMTRNYLKTAIILPKIDKVLLAHQIGMSLSFPILILHENLPKSLVATTIQIATFISLSYLVFIVAASIMTYYKTKEKFKLLFLLGFSFFIIGLCLHLSLSLNIIESNFWVKYGVGVGWILDLVILMFTFSNQIRQTFLKNIHLKEELSQTKLSAANALLEGQLEERKRLSQELHDGISIKMALLKMRLNNFFKQKGKEIRAIITEVDTISEDIRAFTHAISPLNLEEETLEDAIEDLIYKIENQTNLKVDVSLIHFEEGRLKSNQKYNLYQILQELFNNTIKYAEATLIEIQLSTTNQQLQFVYQDNGKGFDTSTIKSGIGLKNIQARLDLLNGSSKIYSTQNGSSFEFLFNL